MRYETRPIDDSVKTGRPISVAISMRWLPYKPASDQFKKGIKGRWQIANDYGWENVIGDGPTEFLKPVE